MATSLRHAAAHTLNAESSTDRYVRAAADAAGYLAGQVESDGYVRAARDYKYYKPHWIRDSSWIAIALLRYSEFAAKSDADGARDAREAAGRAIGFNIKILENHMDNIRNGLGLRFEDPELYKLSNNVPARAGKDGRLYNDGLMDDRPQAGFYRSWLMQHDSIPLVLLSMQEKMRVCGLDEGEKRFLRENAGTMLRYLGKAYLTECSNAWESESHMLHSYDVGAIHAAFQAAKRFSRSGIIDLTERQIDDIAQAHYAGGPLQFLRDQFVRDGVIYRAKKPLSTDPEIGLGVDAAQVFMFTEFGITGDALGDRRIEDSTIKELERTRMSKNGSTEMLATRFDGDNYFEGGRWLLLGLAFADYYAHNGRRDRAAEIVDYVIGKYGGSYPEQELVNPESPGNDRNGYIARNGGQPIQDLAWSYAAVVMSCINLVKEGQARKDVPLRR